MCASEPMLAYCHLDSWEQLSVKFESEFYHFHLKKAFQVVACQNGGHFVLGVWGVRVGEWGWGMGVDCGVGLHELIQTHLF